MSQATAMDVIEGRAAWSVDVGDCLPWLKTLPDNCVQACVTSPPYFNLRDYGTGKWEGGDAACDHIEQTAADSARALTLGPNRDGLGEANAAHQGKKKQYRHLCGKCGAIRIDRQIGIEDTPEAFVARLVEVFEEVRRVLRADGVLLVNIGDSFAGGGGGNYSKGTRNTSGQNVTNVRNRPDWLANAKLKAKDLIGVPWMLAFALRSAGWWLRSECIWHKLAPMPESVTDRPTKAHEQVFLLAKSARYFWDALAVSTPAIHAGQIRVTTEKSHSYASAIGAGIEPSGNGVLGSRVRYADTTNLRTVLTLSPESSKDAHFAVMPSALASICIRAATSAHGCCPACGSPWRRITKRTRKATRPGKDSKVLAALKLPAEEPGRDRGEARFKESTLGQVAGNRDPQRHVTDVETLGWEAGCQCNAGDPVGCLVIDPFTGAGTTGLVARGLGRRFVGAELNAEYAGIARRRIGGANPLFDRPPEEPALFEETAS